MKKIWKFVGLKTIICGKSDLKFNPSRAGPDIFREYDPSSTGGSRNITEIPLMSYTSHLR